MACDRNKLAEIRDAKETVEFFDSENGGLSSAIIWNGYYIWSDGSNRTMRVGGDYRTVMMLDSSWIDPTDPLQVQQEVRENIWFQIRFCQQKLEDSIVEFESARDELKRRASSAEVSGFQPPDKSEVKQVRRLKNRCRQWEKKLNELDELLNPPPQPAPLLSESQKKIMNQNRSQASSVLNELKSLEI